MQLHRAGSCISSQPHGRCKAPLQPLLWTSARSNRHVVRAAALKEAADATSRRELITSLVTGGFLLALPGSSVAATNLCDLVSSPNGLQYCDVKVGEGAEPVQGSLIRCHYTGRLASNNAVFDSSYDRGRPLTFKIGVHEVISGWDLGILGTEGIPPMKEGGKRVLLIPPELGYGSRGAGGVIPPNASLLFEVELLSKPGRR